MVFIPTYLYIKQHTITGKLYFGKTTKNEKQMLEYNGSGKYWKSHIKKYGKKFVVTLWYQLYDNPFDLITDALSMSKSFDIVNNESWLNLKLENGFDGSLSGEYHHLYGKSPTDETRIKISKTLTGGKATNDTKKLLSEQRQGKLHPMFGKSHKDSSKLLMSISLSGENHPMFGIKGINHYNYGKTRTQEFKNELSIKMSGGNAPFFGKHHTDISKQLISDKLKGKLYSQDRIRNISYIYNFISNSGYILLNMTTKEFCKLMGYNHNTVKSAFSIKSIYNNFTRIKIN